MIDQIKQFLTKRNIIGLLVVGIVVLSIPIAVQLAQKQQILKSRASGAEEGQYITHNGVKTLAQMRTELKNSGWAENITTNSNGHRIFHLYQRNATGEYYNCAVNLGDANNMPATIQGAKVGDEVAITVVEKLPDGEDLCLDWYPKIKVTNRTTGAVFQNQCRNGGDQSFKGPGPFGITPVEAQVSDCYFRVPQAGNYTVEVTVDSGKASCSPKTATCDFTAGQSGPSGTGYTVAGHLKDPSGNPVSGVSVDVINDTGGKQTVTTGSDGGYSVSGIAQSGRLYAVRIPDNKGKTSNSDRSYRACNNVNSNTPADQPSYECQLPNRDDCKDRCDFTYTSGGGGTLPAPATASSQCSGTSGNSVTVSWSAVSGAAGAGGYFIRVNRLLQTPPDTSTDGYDPNNPQEKDQGIVASGADTTSKVITVDANAKYHFTVQTLKPGETHSFDVSRIKDAGAQTCTTTSTDCICQSDTCSSVCIFNKLTNPGVSYNSTTKCSLNTVSFHTVPTQDVEKKAWCNRQNRTKGDANGDGKVDEDDYFYYLRAVTGGSIPATVNPDFNGNGSVGTEDLAIWKLGKGT